MTFIHPLDHFHRRFPDSIDILYKGCVFHGEYQVLDRIPKGLNIMASDVSFALMRLFNVGIIEPIRFRPSHSGAAWLGLTVAGPCDRHLKPNVGNAIHWEWKVMMGDFTYPIAALASLKIANK